LDYKVKNTGPNGRNVVLTAAVKKHRDNKVSPQKNPSFKSLKSFDLDVQAQEELALQSLPFNGCRCSKNSKKGCPNSLHWLKMAFRDENWNHFCNYKMY